MLYFLIIPVLIFFLVSIYNHLSDSYLRSYSDQENVEFVSILIPAKNEINRIQACLESISNQSYTNYEVIVLDDNSTDGTYDYIKENFPGIRVEIGSEKPDSWNGKNWACYQLSKLAKGEILIFTDADNWYSSKAIGRTLNAMKIENVDMLSCFPQIMNLSLVEKVFVPLVDHIIYSLLPLRFTTKFKDKSLSAANGQWIAIKNEVYQDIGTHEKVKDSWAEDIQIARLVKEFNYRTLVLSGKRVVFTRMYTNFQEIVNGFNKNLYYMLGGNLASMLFFNLLFFITLLPYLFLFEIGIPFELHSEYFILSFITLFIAWKWFVSRLSGVNLIEILFFHPLMVLYINVMSFVSYSKIKSQKIKW